MINVAKKLCLKHRNHSKLLYKQLPSNSLQNRYSDNRQKSCIEYIVNETNPKIIAKTSCLPRFDIAYSNFRKHDSSHFNYISKRYYSSSNDNGDSPEDTSSGMLSKTFEIV